MIDEEEIKRIYDSLKALNFDARCLRGELYEAAEMNDPARRQVRFLQLQNKARQVQDLADLEWAKYQAIIARTIDEVRHGKRAD